MNARLASALHQVERGLAEIGHHRLLELLRPGLSVAEVDAMMATVGLTATDDLRTLYGWHDGTSGEGAVLGEMYLLYSFYVSPLENALASYSAFTERSGSVWDRSWFPVLADDGGDFLVLNLDPAADGRIDGYATEAQGVEPAFASLADLFETVAVGFDRGLWHLDDGMLDADVHEFYALAAELNPGMRYWQ